MPASLTDLNILTLDCQATGANPQKGHLLEIGWVKTRAAASENRKNTQPEAYLIKLPTGEDIPRSVTRITGIGFADLAEANCSQKIWQKLTDAARQVAAANRCAMCPAVVYFLRFEEPFLRDLHAASHPQSHFPFQLICTHEIAKRLLPGLPRRGLRAVAGYFGHSMSEFRRSADHAVATAFIWKNLAALLKENFRITTLVQLVDWLLSSNPERGSRRLYPMNPEARHMIWISP